MFVKHGSEAFIPDAARVLIGPADMEFTLIPFEPSVAENI